VQPPNNNNNDSSAPPGLPWRHVCMEVTQPLPPGPDNDNSNCNPQRRNALCSTQ
jgi:hypothetical protein